MDFQQDVDYGMRHLTAKVQGKELAQSGKADTTAAELVDHLEQWETFNCIRCTRTHSKGECTMLSQHCVECGIKGHIPASRFCKGRRTWPQEDRQGGGPSQRFLGRSGNAERACN